MPCQQLTHLSPRGIFTSLCQTRSVTQGQPSALWQLKVSGGRIWWKAVEILIWVCPLGQCGLPPLPGEASSSPCPLWTLKRRQWRGSAYERTHSLLPTEFTKCFFFFFFLPMWPVFLSSSSSHLPSPRSVSFRMPFDRWKNGPQNRKPLQARSAFNPQVESLEFWTHITDAENQVNSAENTTWLTYCDLVNHFNHTSFWNVGWFHVLKRKEKQKNYKSPFEITDPLCKATHSSIDYHL